MAYSKKELEKKALKVIKEKLIVNFSELALHLPVSRVTLYAKGINNLNSIKEGIEENKINIKANLRAKMYKSQNSTDTIALYKLLGTQDERDALNGVQSVNTSVNVEFEYPKAPTEIVIIGYEDEIDNKKD
jgi:hypothetical protein